MPFNVDAGILCAVVSQPADNMVSKLSANPNATMSSVMSEMGMWQLATRGLGLRILMVGTLTGLQWGIYDAYKVCICKRVCQVGLVNASCPFRRRPVSKFQSGLPATISDLCKIDDCQYVCLFPGVECT